MSRFFIFPLLFAVWFFAAQFGLMALNRAGTYAAFYFFPPSDTYFFITHTSPLFFAPAIVTGAIMGCVFVALDFVLHRNDKAPEETLLQLLQNGMKSGILAVVLILFCQGILLVLVAQESHKRYHAYPPDIAWSNSIYILQPLLLLASVLWAMGRTLKHYG